MVSRALAKLLLQAIGRAAIFIGKWLPDLPLKEDFELMRRLRRQGRIEIAPAPVIASARRWRQLGALKTTLLNQAVIIGYLLGIFSCAACPLV